MPSGIYIRTSLHKRAISISLLGHRAWNKGMVGIKTNNKGVVPWNRGLTKEVDRRVKLGGKNTSRSLVKNRSRHGEKNPRWVYELDAKLSADYKVIHGRVYAKYGKATRCENPNCEHKCKTYQWSNKDHSYRYPLVRKEWRMLCATCHRQYDIKRANRRGEK